MAVAGVKKYDIFMPALSSTMTEGKIVQWLKQPGDPVAVGEPVMVVESDKADMDVEAFEDGFLAVVLVDEGQSCPVGDTVGIIVSKKDDIPSVQADMSSGGASSSTPTPAQSNGVPSDTVVAPPAPSSAASNSPPPPSPVPGNAPVAPTGPKPDMAEVFMPALSSTMTEGKVVDWLKAEGDAVEAGDMIMVVESDKADMDVESFESGVLAHIAVEAGSSAPVGNAVGYIAKTAADAPAVKAWASAQTSASSSTNVAVATPSPTETTDRPKSDTSPVTSSTPTAAVVVNEGRIVASPLAKAVAKREGVDLKYVVGTGPNGRIVEKDVLEAKAAGVSGNASSATASPTTATSPSGRVLATPDAKKIAKKEKIDLAGLTGTGNFGRITADDVLRAAGKLVVEAVSSTASKKSADSSSDVKTSSKTKKTTPVEMPAGAVAMSAMQKAVVQNMNASLSVPVFRISYKIKTGALDELYAKVKPKGVTMSALLAKAVAMTLVNHPIMNAAYAENAIEYRSDINVAMAVAMPDGGLITPTLKDANNVDLYSLSRTWKDLVKRASEKKLTPDEYNSGTFFISNLGMFGVEQFDAILPPGAPGILAIGAAKPVVGLQDNGLVGVHKEMTVTLTADHRHIYGADGAKFLKDLTNLIEGDVTELLM